MFEKIKYSATAFVLLCVVVFSLAFSGCDGEVVEVEENTPNLDETIWDYIWYEDDYVKFQYPETAYVESQDLKSFYAIYGSESGSNNDWYSYIITESNFTIELTHDAHLYDAVSTVRFSPDDTIIEFFDPYDDKTVVEVNLDAVSLKQIGADELNSFLMYYEGMGSVAYLVHQDGDFYFGEFIDPLSEDIPNISFSLFLNNLSEDINLTFHCAVYDKSDFDLCVQKTNTFFSTLSLLQSQYWEYYPVSEYLLTFSLDT